MLVVGCSSDKETSSNKETSLAKEVTETVECNNLYEEVEKHVSNRISRNFSGKSEDIYHEFDYETRLRRLECISVYRGDCTYSVLCVFSGENNEGNFEIRDYSGYSDERNYEYIDINNYPTFAQKFNFKYSNGIWVEVK